MHSMDGRIVGRDQSGADRTVPLHDTDSGRLGSATPRRAAVGKRISSGAKMVASRATGKGG